MKLVSMHEIAEPCQYSATIINDEDGEEEKETRSRVRE